MDNLDEKLLRVLKLRKESEKLLKKKGIENSEVQKINHKIRMSLIKESDRSVALISVAFLETHIEEAIKTKIHGDAAHIKKCFQFNGPLGTFSSKIDMALCLGLINKVIYKEITLFRKIRNKFAHEYEELNFQTDSILSLVSQIKLCPRDDYQTCTKRQSFLSTLFYLLGYLQGYTHQPKKVEINQTEEEFLKGLDYVRGIKLYT